MDTSLMRTLNHLLLIADQSLNQELSRQLLQTSRESSACILKPKMFIQREKSSPLIIISR